MSFFMAVIKIFPYLWPFIKEMLIGKKTWKQAFRDNRGKTTLVIAVTVSLALNIVLVGNQIKLAYNYLELSRAKQELEKRATLAEKAKGPDSSPKHPLANEKEVQAEIKKEKASSTSKPDNHNDDSELDKIKAEFEQLRRKEAGEH